MRIQGVIFNQVLLSEGNDQVIDDGSSVQLLRVGTFNHPVFGKFEITRETLLKLKENFDNRVRRIDIAVDYFHESEGIAAGWFKEVQLSDEGDALFFVPEWTKNGKQKIEEKELKYISADFDFEFIDTETGINYGPTLFGAGLTNRPHIKAMRALFSENLTDDQREKLNIILNENEGETMDFEKILEAIKGLSADQRAQVLEAVKPEGMMNAEDAKKMNEENATKLSEVTIKLSESKNELKKANERIAELEAEGVKTTKEGKFNVLLSEGKVVEAQREHYLSGDMEKFLEAAQSLNLSEGGTGTDEGSNATNVKLSEKQKAEKELDSKAVKLSEEKGIDYGDAMSIVLDENEELAKKLN